MRKIVAIACGALGAVSMGQGAAEAQPYESGWRLSARARVMCEVTAAQPASVRDARIDLGAVREACNSAHGYQLEVRFDNLTGGELQIGDERHAIPQDGVVLIASNKPQWRTSHWRVRNAVYGDSGDGVAVTLLITPTT